MDQNENKPEQPESPLRPDFPKPASAVTGQMKTHPSNPLFRFPTDDNLKAVMNVLNEDSKSHFPSGKPSRDGGDHKCPDEGNCELCWMVGVAGESKMLDKYVQTAAVEMLGPLVVMLPYPRVWGFAFFCFMLGMRAERRDRDQAELAQLEKLMAAGTSTES